MNRHNFLKIILSLIFTYFIFYFSAYFAIFKNEDFYKKEFKKYNIFQQFPNEDILIINRTVLEYLNPVKCTKFKNYLLIPFFNEKEKSHLKDIKNLFLSMNRICLIFFIIFLLLFKRNSWLLFLKSLFTSSLISLSVIFILFIGISLNFQFIFSGMHYIFFEPGTWTFDPLNNNIVNLYNEDFFMDFAIEIGMKIFFVSLFLFFASLLAIKLLNKRKLFK